MRKVFIGGNWKSNGNLNFVKSHFENVLNRLSFDSNKCEVIVSPIFLHLGYAKQINQSQVQLSTQNISLTSEGAFTGEISAVAVKDFGINWSIIGHSERRNLLNETLEVVATKVKRA